MLALCMPYLSQRVDTVLSTGCHSMYSELCRVRHTHFTLPRIKDQFANRGKEFVVFEEVEVCQIMTF